MAENVPVSGTDIRLADSARRFRRLVTGVDADGKSRFEEDAQSPHLHVMAGLGTFVYTSLWRTKGTLVETAGLCTMAFLNMLLVGLR
ncbi:hypothetical protein [Streptomyces chartreusis]|uniref:Uncharacterized protein n=1 Tax=Streptomyces chartreusis TaxID=1969 RepID=A0A7I0Y8Z6_STRCX|nr:hypothetical protein [Streptomyces chartreusis]QKZ15977.1 hypothetical protein HUT05_00270 [Streptomyces chartreusis]